MHPFIRRIAAAVAALVTAAFLITSPVAGNSRIDALTNDFRASHGLPAVATSSTLTDLARQRAVETYQYVQRHGNLDPGEKGPAGGWAHDFWWWGASGCAGIGENLHFRVPADADPAAYSVNAWVGSPDHRANMLDRWDVMGSAIFLAPDGGHYAVQLFGRDCGTRAPAPTPAPAPAPTPAPPAPAPASPAPVPAPQVALPDTALPKADGPYAQYIVIKMRLGGWL